MSQLRLEAAPKIGTPERVTAPAAVAQVVRVQVIKAHIGTHKTKTRSQVHGTGKKMYKQKGTGSARHSDRCAPQFRSGGVAHGPTGLKRRVKLNKKASLAVRRSLVAHLSSENLLFVLHGVDENMTPSTKTVVSLLKENNLSHAVIVTDNEALRRSARNIPNVTLCNNGVIDAATMVRSHPVLIDAASYDLFRERCFPVTIEEGIEEGAAQ